LTLLNVGWYIPSAPKRAAPVGPGGRVICRRPRGATFRETQEWLVTYFAPLAASFQFVNSIHVPWWYRYPLCVAVGVPLIVAAMCASGYGARLSTGMTKPRSRVVYLFFACCWLVMAVMCGIAGGRLPQAGWQVNALGEAMFTCAIVALVMPGRAAVRGRARPYFWLHPPGGGAANPAG
jgi:hypothetical protein